MKAVRDLLVLPVAITFASLLAGGCYTQLALNDDEPASAVEPQPALVVDPPPTVIIIQPGVEPPWYMPPVVGVAASPAPSVSPTRDIGNQRPESGNECSGSVRSESAGTGVRTTGSGRGGR